MLKYILIVVFIFESVYSDGCQQHTRCRDCITDNSVCVWCAEVDYNGTRCRQNIDDASWCNGHMQIPEGYANVTGAQNFSSDLGKIVQITPQKFDMKLRPGQWVPVNFSFQAVSDYPVDLYFLIDASITMKEVVKSVKSQAFNIFTTLKSKTDNVYLGYGTFVDKNAFPFIGSVDQLAYSFKHQLNLTDKYGDFESKMANFKFTSNRDTAEGGFDALAQIMSCGIDLGWRNESRKIIVYMSDGPYHIAGDGKIAGIYKPYDGKCHTDKDGKYTKELTMDYPSLSQIKKLALQNDTIIIFAVSEEEANNYLPIQTQYLNTAFVEYLSEGTMGRRLTEIINTIYEKITKYIQLKATVEFGKLDNYEIAVEPDCISEKRNQLCDIHSGKVKHFQAKIRLVEYDGVDKNTLHLSVKGLNEKLTINIDVINDCECKTNSTPSPVCSGYLLECGICVCSDNKKGNKCECSGDSVAVDDKSSCIREGSTKICSGQGECVCGACDCRPGFAGSFCECDMKKCPIGANGAKCSDHGSCACEKCKCKNGWSKEACDCELSETKCKTGEKMCHGRGICECNQCQCDPIAEWDERLSFDAQCLMEPCTGCHNQQCRTLENCVLCHVNEEQGCDSLCAPGIDITIDTKDDIENTTDYNICNNIKVSPGCYTNFTYRYNNEKYRLSLYIQKKKNCAEIYYISGIVTLVVLLAIGIATIIAWKVLTDARDRREFKEFVSKYEQEIDACTNPCYIAPKTTFTNPQFKKGSISR